MLKIAICDDIPDICEQIKTYIMDNSTNNQEEQMFIHTFYSGESLIQEIQDINIYDVIILDIELKNINGVEVGNIIRKQLKDYNTKIIYISSKNDYDRQLFDVQPFNFLEKPIDKDKLIKNINIIADLINVQNQTFEFKIGKDIFKIPYNNILYFESETREIKLVSVDKEYRFYAKIKEIKQKLPEFFIQPHRSYIANYEFIKHFKYEELKMYNDDIIPISRDKRKEIRNLQIELEQ